MRLLCKNAGGHGDALAVVGENSLTASFVATSLLESHSIKLKWYLHRGLHSEFYAVSSDLGVASKESLTNSKSPLTRKD